MLPPSLLPFIHPTIHLTSMHPAFINICLYVTLCWILRVQKRIVPDEKKKGQSLTPSSSPLSEGDREVCE